MSRILLIDADAFFVAVARQVDPAGAGAASLLIVGGRPGSRGVVCSASYETRAFGVRSGMPISQALRLCPTATCVPVPRTACADTSRAIRRVLDNFTPLVEAASIDEWYLDLSGTEALYHHEPVGETARRIRHEVFAQTGMRVSIGVGPNKLVAKLAAERAKPKPGTGATGVHVVEDAGVVDFMRTLDLGDIPGIGPKLQEKLASVGMVAVREVLEADAASLAQWLGRETAYRVLRKARGESDAAVEPRTPAKQVSREETFDRDIADAAALRRELQQLAHRVAADLRGDHLEARTITVKVRDQRFITRTMSRTFDAPISSDAAIADAAQDLLRALRKDWSAPVRLAGVALSKFTPRRDAEQLGMFGGGGAANVGDSGESLRDRELSRAVDRVREKFGDAAIRAGAPRSAPLGEKGARKPR
ncbi:MAG: DNA polymerase IV [Gemmatimonadaceae bacterium]|nr:DNA polymerase IV [Gemmatimonadaceae bacterium]